MTVAESGAPQCTDCGACCFSRLQDYVRVMGVDYERMSDQARQFTHFIGNQVFMKMVDGHCAALTHSQGRFLCSIYEHRPDACHWLERGSGLCAAERHEKASRTTQLVSASRLKRGDR